MTLSRILNGHLTRACQRLFLLTALLIPFIWITAAQAQSNALVADLSNANVSINTDFNGTSVLLFGSINGETGDDIIVVISGPEKEIATRLKSKVSGIWINTQSISWKNAPSYYQIFSNKPLAEIASADLLKSLAVGSEYLELQHINNDELKTDDLIKWNTALYRNMTAASLWSINESSVQVIRGALFRTQVSLPANIVVGDYDVRILHFRDGVLLAEDSTAIAVNKAGISALIYQFAHEYAIFYGLFAIAFAVFAGWLAAAIFPKH